jgi:hypothetical protein
MSYHALHRRNLRLSDVVNSLSVSTDSFVMRPRSTDQNKFGWEPFLGTAFCTHSVAIRKKRLAQIDATQDKCGTPFQEYWVPANQMIDRIEELRVHGFVLVVWSGHGRYRSARHG